MKEIFFRLFINLIFLIFYCVNSMLALCGGVKEELNSKYEDGEQYESKDVYGEKSAYRIEQINSTNGLYYENIGSLNVFYTEWKLATYINLTHMADEANHLDAVLVTIRNVCDKIGQRNLTFVTECDRSVYQADLMLGESKEYSVKWFYESTDVFAQYREKRFVGAIFGGLIGVLGLSEAINLKENFDQLESRQIDIESLYKKQTSLLKSTIDYVNVSTQLHENQLMEVKNIIKEIELVLNSTQEQMQMLNDLMISETLHIKFLSLMDYFILLVIQYERKQSLFLESIAVSHKNPSSPIIIPPKIFVEELEKIQNYASKMSLYLPFEVKSENLASFYQISKPEMRIHKGILIVSLSVPLIRKDKFNLYKITSLPFREKNSNLFGLLVPQYEYIAVHDEDSQYIGLTESILDDCIQASAYRFICQQTFPIFTSFENGPCEMNALIGEKLSKYCDVRVLSNNSNELWIKLRNPNSYIYVLPSYQVIRFYYGDKKIHERLHGTGIITIEPGCVVKSNGMKITAFQTFESNYTIIHKSSSPILIDISVEFNNLIEMSGFKFPDSDPVTLIGNGEKDKLLEISVSLSELKVMEENLLKDLTPKALKSEVSLGYYVIGVLIFVVVFLIGKYVFKKINACRIRKQHNQRTVNKVIYCGEDENGYALPIKKIINKSVHGNGEEDGYIHPINDVEIISNV